MLNRKAIFSSIILSICFFVATLCTSYGSDFHSPRTDGLGGAGHASPLLGDSIYLNPSFLSFVQTHNLSFNYLVYGQGQVNTPNGMMNYYGHNINISVMDGTAESLFQAGVAYTVRDDSSIIHAGISKKILPRLSVGMGGKFIFPNNSAGTHYTDGNLSVTGIIASWCQASLIGDNLFATASGLGFNREFVLGTKVNIMGILLLYADPHIFSDLPSAQSFGYEAGAEFPFFSDFFLRLGTFKNSNIPYQAQLGDGYGLGVGWIAPKISLDYSLSRAVFPISALSHNFGVSIYF